MLWRPFFLFFCFLQELTTEGFFFCTLAKVRVVAMAMGLVKKKTYKNPVVTFFHHLPITN